MSQTQKSKQKPIMNKQNSSGKKLRNIKLAVILLNLKWIKNMTNFNQEVLLGTGLGLFQEHRISNWYLESVHLEKAQRRKGTE